jgi:hypothetical protein
MESREHRARRKATARIAMVLLAAPALLLAHLVRTRRRSRRPPLPPCPAGAVHGTPPLVEVVDFGKTRIPAVVIGRSLYYALRRVGLGYYRAAVVALSVASYWPLALNLVLRYAWPAAAVRTAHAWATIAVSSVADMAMLASAWGAWHFFSAAAPDIDDLISTSTQGASLKHWLRNRIRLRIQIPVIVLSISLAVILTILASKVTEIRATSYMSSVLMALIGGNVCYWLYTVAELSFRLHFCKPLKLNWFDPARTPAILRMCDCYSFTAGALVAGVVCVEAFAVLIPTRNGSTAIASLAVIFPIFAAITALCVGVQPYISVYLLVKHAKNRTLDEIATLITTSAPTALKRKKVVELVTIHRDISNQPCLPIGIPSVVQYSAAILGTLAAYFLQKYAT